MIKFLLSLFCVLSPSQLFAQDSVSELPRAHTSALQDFLTKHPKLRFLSAREMDQASLKDMRKSFGPRLMPYYRTGDFNWDGIPDFAMILVQDGPPAQDLGPGIAETHRHRHSLTVVIFNGQKFNRYRAAFVESINGPLVSFLYATKEKKKRLYFAVYETDEHFIMSPAGNRYVVDHFRDN